METETDRQRHTEREVLETETDTEREVLETKTDRQRQEKSWGSSWRFSRDKNKRVKAGGGGEKGEGRGRAGKGGGGWGRGGGVKSVDNSSRTARVARKGCWVNCFVTVTVVRTRRDSAPVN